MKNMALNVAGLVFLLVSVLHFFRYYKSLEVVVATHIIPLEWSLYGGGFTLVLAIWMFLAAGGK